MHRLFIAATVAALAVLAAGPARAAVWTGTVVAKDPARAAVVTASPGGVMRTLRAAPSRIRSLRLGHRVSARAARLADGTFRAGSVRVVGRAKRATIRAVVVRYERRRSRYLVSAGGTVFAVARASGTRLLASSHEAKPGDQVVATVTVQPGAATPAATNVTTVGRVGVLELEGIVTEIAPGSLKLVVARAGFVTVALPADFVAPPSLAQFDEVELLVGVGTDGSFTLVALQGDEGEDEDGHGVELDGDELEAEGIVTSLGADSITVQPGKDATPVTCAIPAGKSIGSIEPGDRVEMECRLVSANQFVLKEVEREDDDEDDDDEDDDDEEDDDEEDDDD